MYINYLDLFSAEVGGEYGSAHQFVQEEYQACLGSHPLCDSTVRIHFCRDRMNADDYVVRAPVSYDDRGVYLFDHARLKARIDFDSIGAGTWTILCDPDFHPPFFAILLEYVAYLQALRRRRFLCHASGFVFDGKAILCAAGRNVGKTNTLLAFLYDGASYLADDWCLLDEKGAAYALPKRLHLFDYNFSSFPDLIHRVDSSLSPLWEFYSRVMNGEYQLPADFVTELRDNLRTRVDPQRLFPTQVVPSVKRLDNVFFLTRNVRNPERGIYTQTLERATLVERLMAITSFEQKPFRLAYSLHKARTGRPNPFLEKEADCLRSLMDGCFSKTPLFEIFTPGQAHSKEVKARIQEIVRRG